MYALIFMNLMKFIVSEIRELNLQKLIINEYWWNSSMLVHKLFTIRSLCQSYTYTIQFDVYIGFLNALKLEFFVIALTRNQCHNHL